MAVVPALSSGHAEITAFCVRIKCWQSAVLDVGVSRFFRKGVRMVV